MPVNKRSHRLLHNNVYQGKTRLSWRIWGAPLQCLAVGLQTIAEVMEEAVDRPLTHRMALRLESRGQLGRTLAGPPQERHRVATGHRIKQGFEGTDEVRILRTQWFTPPARTAYPLHRSLGGRGRDRVSEFLQAGSDGGPG